MKHIRHIYGHLTFLGKNTKSVLMNGVEKQILEVDKNKKLWYNMFVEYEATKLYNIA